MENEMKFDIINWCMDNFNEEERSWIKETSQEVMTNKYWKQHLSESDFSLQSDGFSEPMDDWDFSSPQP